MSPARLIVWMVLCQVASASQISLAAGTRSPIPPAADRAAAEKLLASVFTPPATPLEAGQQAVKMLETGLETRDSTTDRYVLLDNALKAAVKAGDAQLAVKAADALDVFFEVDGEALKAEALAKVYAAVPLPATAGLLAEAQMACAEHAASAADLDLAVKLAGQAMATAREAHNPERSAALRARSSAIGQLAAHGQELKQAMQTLKTAPNDPAASLLVGQWLCFVRGQWETGLPMLAKGSDEKIKALAQHELAVPIDPEKQCDLATGWWNVAERATKATAPALRQHALEWYRRALPGLNGLSKSLAEKRLAVAVAVNLPTTRPAEEPARRWRDLTLTPSKTAQRVAGIVTLPGKGRVTTAESFRPPVTFRIIAQTDSTNIRLAYAAHQIIFDWELNKEELRVDGGPANGRHKKGAGYIPPNTWATIELTVTPGKMIILVDGQPRYETEADFSQINEHLAVFTMRGTVQVKSVMVQVP